MFCPAFSRGPSLTEALRGVCGALCRWRGMQVQGFGVPDPLQAPNHPPMDVA